MIRICFIDVQAAERVAKCERKHIDVWPKLLRITLVQISVSATET
jgi:hypothetical protein